MSEEQLHTFDFDETTEIENNQQQERTAVHKKEENRPTGCLSDAVMDDLQSRWNAVQVDFVDKPRVSVEQAEALVAETLDKVCQTHIDNKTSLDEAWQNREDISTEDLRMALQRYRSFFNHILKM
jgi:hypothetical protein